MKKRCKNVKQGQPKKWFFPKRVNSRPKKLFSLSFFSQRTAISSLQKLDKLFFNFFRRKKYFLWSFPPLFRPPNGNAKSDSWRMLQIVVRSAIFSLMISRENVPFFFFSDVLCRYFFLSWKENGKKFLPGLTRSVIPFFLCVREFCYFLHFHFSSNFFSPRKSAAQNNNSSESGVAFFVKTDRKEGNGSLVSLLKDCLTCKKFRQRRLLMAVCICYNCYCKLAFKRIFVAFWKLSDLFGVVNFSV